MTVDGLAALSALVAAEPLIDQQLEQRAKSKFARYFPDSGPLAREHYPKHLAFFEAGATKRERLLMAANRVGKTETGAYELTCHLTGLYPAWWKGRRFDGPIRAWAAGDTATTVRDIIQAALLGHPGAPGTGMIPFHLLDGEPTGRQGVPGAKETIRVKHASGGTSVLVLRSYDQRREAFQGTSQHVIWLDEECPDAVYTECLLRTMDTPDLPGGGLLMLTFTPLMGLTPLILTFLPDGREAAESKSKFVVTATWDDAPHLSVEAREELWNSIPPYQRDARSKGIPQLGSGAIYPVPESEIVVPDMPIPPHWPRCFGFDAGGGSKPSAAVWLAKNPEAQVWYAYSVYKSAAAEPVIHATAVKSRGPWIPGVGDCAALIMLAHDSEQLIQAYRNLGLDITLPDKAVETGIYDVWQLLSTGGLKIFASCKALLEEYRLYRRDEKGKIVKQNDHLMDALRYAVRSGRARAKVQPVKGEPSEPVSRFARHEQSWMA